MEACAEGVRRAIASTDMGTEVIIVDDGSRDRTAEQAQKYLGTLPGFQLVRIAHQGKGAALKAGVAVSSGDYVFLADADWSMPPEQISRFLPPRLDGFGIAIASRELPSSQRHGEPLARHLLGRAFNRLVRICILKDIPDSQCGFKCLRGEVARRLFPQIETQGWAFDVELLALARQAGDSIVQQPIDWTYNNDSRVQPWKHAPQMARDVLRIRRRMRQFS
jgi:dolichyl-phosphate beta-glucosyltransferase